MAQQYNTVIEGRGLAGYCMPKLAGYILTSVGLL